MAVRILGDFEWLLLLNGWFLGSFANLAKTDVSFQNREMTRISDERKKVCAMQARTCRLVNLRLSNLQTSR